MRKRISDRELTALFREYRADCLLSGEAHWRGEIPPSAERAAERAFAAMDACAAGVPLTAAGGAAAALKALAITVAASAVLCAGSYAAVPAAREYAASLFGGSQRTEEPAGGLAPGQYAIPSPGEGFRVTDEAVNERLAARWFRSDRQQVLVEIAYTLPEELAAPHEAEYVSVAGRDGTVYAADGAEYLILRDGDVYIFIAYFNADRQELLDYAALLAAQND